MLLDALLSEGVNHLPIHQSIQNDLHRLLNTKLGSLKHLPDYGLPDLQWIYNSFPKGIYDFMSMVQEKIEKYEPRLKNISIENINQDKNFCVLNLAIGAEIINQGNASFEGRFYSAGHVNLACRETSNE